jgi:hypothetical protein
MDFPEKKIAKLTPNHFSQSVSPSKVMFLSTVSCPAWKVVTAGAFPDPEMETYNLLIVVLEHFALL